MKNTIKGLLNSKERINRLYFIDRLIHKYYISTDMIEVLDYISWRSPTTCYNSCQGTSLGNFKGERKYQFEKTNRQIFITYNSQQKPKYLGVFLNSVTWKMKIPLKKKLTGKKWNILKKIGKNGGIHERKRFSILTAGQDFLRSFRGGGKSLSSAFGTQDLAHDPWNSGAMWEDATPISPVASHPPTLSSPGCSCSSGHSKHHSHGRALTNWI